MTDKGRWILAFDTGCSACTDIIDRVQIVAGDRLEVAHLADRRVQQLRESALGEQPPWVPTLLAVDGKKARAWTGPALSLRLARLLGPGRALRLARQINASEVVRNPERRRLLKTVPGAAAAAFLLSGGLVGVASGKATAAQPGKEVDLSQYMYQKLGFSAADLRVSELDAASIDTSRFEQAMSGLVTRARTSGYGVGQLRLYEVVVPFDKPGLANPVVEMAQYELLRGGATVGGVSYIAGPNDSLAYSTAKREDGNFEIFVDRHGQSEYALLDVNGKPIESSPPIDPVTVQPFSACTDICQILCSGGAVGTLAKCLSRCVLTPNPIFCEALCAMILSLGCWVGCDRLCKLIGQ